MLTVMYRRSMFIIAFSCMIPTHAMDTFDDAVLVDVLSDQTENNSDNDDWVLPEDEFEHAVIIENVSEKKKNKPLLLNGEKLLNDIIFKGDNTTLFTLLEATRKTLIKPHTYDSLHAENNNAEIKKTVAYYKHLGHRLYEAIKFQNLDAVHLLLAYGAYLKPKYFEGKTALEVAREWSVGETGQQIASVIERVGYDFVLQAHEGINRVPLRTAAKEGHVDIAYTLLINGADINALCYRNYTPLYAAVRRENTAVVRLLLEHGAHLDRLCDDENDQGTALYAAVAKYDEETVCLLLGAGASSDILCNYHDYTHKKMSKHTVFHRVLQQRENDMLACLLEKAIHINLHARDSNGKTLLQTACESNNDEAARMILAYAAHNEPSAHYIATLVTALSIASLCDMSDGALGNELIGEAQKHGHYDLECLLHDSAI